MRAPEIVAGEKKLETYILELTRLDQKRQEYLKSKHKHIQANMVLSEIIELNKEAIRKFPFMKETLLNFERIL